MDRRSLLRAVPVGVGGSIAGCLTRTSLGLSTPSCLRTGTVSLSAEDAEFVVITNDDTVESHLFTLRNRSDCQVRVDPESWRIRHHSDNGWESVATGDGEGEPITLSTADQHQWSLSLSPHPTPKDHDKSFIVADIPAGESIFDLILHMGDGTRLMRHAAFTLVKRKSCE